MTIVDNRDEFLKALLDYLPQDCKAVELGVLYGDFSEKILSILKPKTLFLIDPYKTDETKTYGEGLNNLPTAYSNEQDYQNLVKRFENEIKVGKVFVLKNYSHMIVGLVGDNIYDLIYIDSSHLKEDVKKDLNDWLPKLKYGGIICVHDYVDIKGFGVVEATDEFINEHGFEKIIFNENGGDLALKKIVHEN